MAQREPKEGEQDNAVDEQSEVSGPFELLRRPHELGPYQR
jgi:hypothetical protein